MREIVVNTQALTFSADRLGDAADAAGSLRHDVPLGEMSAVMSGSESAVAADLAGAA